MSSTSFFYPSKQRGIELDRDLRLKLIESLGWCLAHPAVHSLHNIQIRKGWTPRPSDYGSYYDLASILVDMKETDLGQPNGLVLHTILESLKRSTSLNFGEVSAREKHPQITTLREPFYREAEVATLIKWLDLDSQNSIALAYVDGEDFRESKKKLIQAIDALEILAPEFWAEFCAITKQVILARPSGQQKLTFRGASSFALWGSITLNVDYHQEWWLFIPSLVHEHSHNILFGMARNEALVLNDPEALYYSPLRQQLRPMDGIFHAAFVSAREAISANQAIGTLKSGKISEQHLIAIEDYCDDVRKSSSRAFWDCLAVLETKGELSDLGDRILRDSKLAMLQNGVFS
jgi:hypothetical protein